MKGAAELLRWLHEHGIICVLATATQEPTAVSRLQSAGLLEYLSLRVTGNMVQNSKPHPETYLKAAEVAGVPIEECLVLEDSFNGIRAGRASGAIVGMVPDCLPFDESCAPYCDQVFDSLLDVIRWIEPPEFTPLEESISFYTRNDFAIINRLLTGNWDALWRSAQIAYEDNRGILEEYKTGVRSMRSDYDVQWTNSLKKRLINKLDDSAKAMIAANAKQDLSNLLGAMKPAQEALHLYRTAWIGEAFASAAGYPYSVEYQALPFNVGDILELKIISSYSLTPYREDEDVGSDFYRYEMQASKGTPVLKLDSFITHNEAGEVLLPPMKCRVTAIRAANQARCRGIIELEYVEALPVELADQ